MICTAARSWASCSRNITAIEMSTTTRSSAACTGLRREHDAERAGDREHRAEEEDDDLDVHADSSSAAVASALALLRAGGTPKPSSPDQTIAALVGGGARRRRRAHPRARVVVLAAEPQLPRLAPGPAVVVDEQLALRVDRVRAVGERELEQLRLGDRLGRARLDAEVAVDAAEVVDLVDEAVALARRDRRVGRVVGAAHVDALAPGTRRRTARSRCTSPCRRRSG